MEAFPRGLIGLIAQVREQLLVEMTAPASDPVGHLEKVKDSSTSSLQHDAEAARAAQLYHELLGKTSDYLRSEFEGTAEDYRLIQELNFVTKNKYEELLGNAKATKEALKTSNERIAYLKPVLERIDSVENQVNDLERTIFRLDTYAKQLELRYKSLEKR